MSRILLISDTIQLDGAIHRFYIEGDKKGSKNGWYIFFDDFVSCGVFGSWKTDCSKVWCSQQLLKMNSSERFIFDKKVKEAKIQWMKWLEYGGLLKKRHH